MSILIGWAEESLVPEKKVSLAGQFFERISQYVESEISVTAMAVEKGQEQMILLHKVLRKLKPEHRQILWLIYFEGFSAKEAAVILKRSAHSVESLTYRAKKALKAQLETEGFHYEDL